MKYHLKNKVVWLTGASKGIGYHLATALIQAGAQLIVSARDTSVIADMTASDHIDCDVTQAEDCLLYTSPSPRDLSTSRMPSSA